MGFLSPILALAILAQYSIDLTLPFGLGGIPPPLVIFQPIPGSGLRKVQPILYLNWTKEPFEILDLHIF